METALALLTEEARLELRHVFGVLVSAKFERRMPDGRWKCVGIMGFLLAVPLCLSPFGKSRETRQNAHTRPAGHATP